MKQLLLAIICFTITVSEPVPHVMDGDTFLAVFLLFHNQAITERIRVLDIDTPERNEGAPYLAAKAFTKEWLDQGPFQIETCKRDAFGRSLAVVRRDRELLADELRKAGHAK